MVVVFQFFLKLSQVGMARVIMHQKIGLMARSCKLMAC